MIEGYGYERRGKKDRIFLLITIIIVLTGAYGFLAMLLCGDIFYIGRFRHFFYAEDYLLLMYLAVFIASFLSAVSVPIVDKLGLRDDWVMLIFGAGFIFFLFVLVSLSCMSHYNYIPSWLHWL